MRKWRFYFYDVRNNTKRPLKYEVDEWKNFGISYGREKDTSVVKNYSAGFTFIKEDAAYLKDIVLTRGFNVQIRLQVYCMEAIGKEKLEYTGYLDLTDPTMTGNTFNCPIYSGGFFTMLENSWDKEFEIKAFDKNSDFEDEQNNLEFKDIDFTGGEYALEEELALLDDTQKDGDVEIQLKTTYMYQPGQDAYYRQDNHYMPLKRIYQRDKKLSFFNDATLLTVMTNNDPAQYMTVTRDQCFIISPDRVNGGLLYYTLPANNLGRIVIDNIPLKNSYDKTLTGTFRYTVVTQLWSYIYDESSQQSWIPWGSNTLVSDYKQSQCTSDNGRITAYNGDTVKVEFPDYHFNDIVLSSPFIVDLTNYLKSFGNISKGYMVAFALKFLIRIRYGNDNLTSNWVELSRGTDFTFIPTKEFKIRYSLKQFVLNKNKTVHGIFPGDLFRSMIDKFNAIYKVHKTNPPTRTKSYKYKVEINTEELDSLLVMISSGTSLLGSKQALIDSGIQCSVISSLKDFCDFAYRVFALKFFCRYDKEADTYYLAFIKIENCYQNTKIQDIDSIADLTITSDRENLYTSIKAGYENSKDAIFGQLEYNTANQFETGITERETNELDLISPYKGGALDLETYVHEKYHNFEDTQEGSSDIFILWTTFDKKEFGNSTSRNDLRKPYSITSDNIRNAINTGITPKRILLNHDKELSSYFLFDNTLKFISSQRNPHFECVTFSPITREFTHALENSDMILSGNNYTKPFLMEVKIPAVYRLIEAIDKNQLGYFQFKMGKKTYKGYLADGTESIQVNPMNEQATTIKLIAHKNSDL